MLHSNRTHLIFWAAGRVRGSAFEPGYESLVETFLADVAADSHQPTNVYGLSGQYRDVSRSRRIRLDLRRRGPRHRSAAGQRLHRAAGPAARSGPGWARCLTDEQLQAEIEHVVAADDLPQTSADIYFLVTPNGLGSCEATGPSSCALGRDDASGYCGYHSATPHGSARTP